MEETAHRFEPTGLTGIYRWYLRAGGRNLPALLLFGKDSLPLKNTELDKEILALHWLTPEELKAKARCTARLSCSNASTTTGRKKFSRSRCCPGPMAERIVVGMSGGVDSAVAALLLKREGYDVVGLFMKNWEDDDSDEYCSTRAGLHRRGRGGRRDRHRAGGVNFAAEYKDRVFAEFLREYQAGRTPNPDVLCNAEIKFKAFLRPCDEAGADAASPPGTTPRTRALRTDFQGPYGF
jgi:hypothetical protein